MSYRTQINDAFRLNLYTVVPDYQGTPLSNADLKISLCVRVYIKMIPWKFCILNPKISQVICP